MKTKILFAFILIISAFSGCKKDSKDESKEIQLVIDHYQKPASDGGLFLTYVAQTGSDIGSSLWGSIYDQIVGFNYEQGYRYTLIVVVKTFAKPQADGSTSVITLKAINSKVKIADDVVFEIPLKLNNANFVTGNAASGYKILDKIKLDCGTLCTDLTQAITGSTTEIIAKCVHNPDGSYLIKELKVK
jgi:hypothetical protein